MKLQEFIVVSLLVVASSASRLEARPQRTVRSISIPSDSDYDSFYRGYMPIASSFNNDLRYADKRAAMGVDLPDYILHYNGKPMPPNIGNYREKMQKNGRKK